ncbi:Zinc finger, RING-type [Sesbania bispinosa]|nr:Zinc finger, RING-type [Sesbania bispinosa]
MSPLIRVAIGVNLICGSHTFKMFMKYSILLHTYLKWILDFLYHFMQSPSQPSVCHYVSTHEDVDCAVCLSKMRDREEIRVLRCHHVFHRDCLDTWVGFNKATCPLCRDSLLCSTRE